MLSLTAIVVPALAQSDPPMAMRGFDAGLIEPQSGALADGFPALFNLSTRAPVREGASIMIGGFVLRGEAPKRVLIRARGPSLAAAGVAGAMGDPSLRLFSGTTPIGFNDNWRDSQQAEIAATGRAPNFDAEAALIATLAPGPYTVHVQDALGAPGVAIFEVIGIDEEVDARLFNLSTRARVETGADVSIGGFVIRGDTPKQVLIRARGPSLGGLPAGTTLSDPTVELFSGTSSIAYNDDWQTSASAAAIQATGRAPLDPRESAILATLEPGPYTAILRGAGGASGVGIVEVIAIDEDALALGVNQALLGPLAGAWIRAYRLDALSAPIEGPVRANASLTDLTRAGSFNLMLNGVSDDEWIVVTARGGLDIDADDDGVLDAVPTVNAGTIHAIARAADWRAGARVNALTDIAWHYARGWLGQASVQAMAERLDEVAGYLLTADLNGDGQIDARDLLRFDPRSSAHRNALSIAYARLQQSAGYLEAIHEDVDDSARAAVINDLFGAHLSPSMPAYLREEVRVEVSRFGPGRVVADHGGLVHDSARDPGAQQAVAFFERDSARITFSATPTAETRILDWQGCDWISADLSQCEIDLYANRHVTVSFGYEEADIVPGFVDLSLATSLIRTGNTLEVVVDAEDAALLARMDGLGAGGFIAGVADDGPFLLRVLGKAQPSAQRWLLETTEARLDEVVRQGSGTLSRALSHDDLAPTGFTPQAVPSGPQVRLLPPTRAGDTTFRLQIGDPVPEGALLPQAAIEGELIWESANGSKIRAAGEVDVSIDLDAGVAYRLLSGLEYFKFIPSVTVQPALSLSADGALETPKTEDEQDALRIRIGTLKFKPIKFMVGPVPVWVTPETEIYLGVNGKVEAHLATGIAYQLTVRGGAVYDRGVWGPVSGVDRQWHLDTPPVSLAGEAELKGYVSVDSALMLYSATGPGMSLEAFARPRAKLGLDPDCVVALDYALWAGLGADFVWKSADSITQFGQLIGLEPNFEFKLIDWEHKVWGGVLDGCGAQPPVLNVRGANIDQTLILGTHAPQSTVYTLTNGGEIAMPWSVQHPADGVVSVSPGSGVLLPGASVPVTVSVANTHQLPLGRYTARIDFENDYVGGIGMSGLGSTDQTVRLNVLAETFAAPQSVFAQRLGTQGARIDWSYPQASLNQLQGFRVWYTTDPNLVSNWVKAADLDRDARSVTLSGLPQATLYVSIEAFGADSTLQQAYSAPLVMLGSGDGPPPPPTSGRLNDTGITFSGHATSGNATTCDPSHPAGQDCHYGRDAQAAAGTLAKVGGGSAGFDFTKISNSGNSLAADATLGSGPNDWACTLDNVTGLIWEVKVNDFNHLRNAGHTYTWYDPNRPLGNPGIPNGGGCSGSACDTADFVNTVNAQGLCGASDWRMPTLRELHGIVDYGRYGLFTPSIDTEYFPNTVNEKTQRSHYWSGTPFGVGEDSDAAWYVDFGYGKTFHESSGNGRAVRLVRDAIPRLN